MGDPDLLVTGARPAYEAGWAPVSKVLPSVSARRTAAAGTPIPGTGGGDWAGEGGAPRQGPGPGRGARPSESAGR